MHRPTLRQLEYLSVLAKTLNYRQTAEQLNVTQPTLSTQIKDLEVSLRVKLFERDNRNVLLTPIGKILADKASIILKDTDDLCSAAHQAGKSLGGPIRLGVPPSIGPYLLPRVLPVLHAEFPELQLLISEAPPRHLEAGLNEGNFDLLITAIPVLIGNAVTAPLYIEPLVVGASKENPVSKNAVISLGDLKGEKLLSLGKGHQLFEQASQLAVAHGCELLEGYEGSSLDAIKAMVSLNMGVSFFPMLYANSEISENTAIIPFKGGVNSRQVGMVWRKTSPRTEDFDRLSNIMHTVLEVEFSGIIQLVR